MDYIRQVAPKADLYSIASGDRYKNGVLESQAIDWLLKNTPDFLGTANHSGFIDEDFMIPYYKKIYDKGCYLVCSAGNKQEEINTIAKGDMWKAIGACKMYKECPKVERDYVGGEEMDFVCLHGLKATYDDKRHNGTSFSYPVFMGMLALVQCFFMEKTGKKLTHEQLDRFVIDNCIDIGEEGRDVESGYGLFILPDPKTIQIKKYNENYKESEEEKMSKYNKLEEIPEWGRVTVEKLIKKKVLKGDENGDLNMSEDLLRTLVIHDRLGLYDLSK